MRLSQFIIALLFVVAAGISIFSFVFSVYDTEGYNIDLSEDESTKSLAVMQEEFKAQQQELDTIGDSIFDETPGQPGAEIKAGEISEGDLIAAAGRAIANVPSYLNSFFKLVISMFNAVGLGAIPAVWWIITSFIIIISLLALGVFVKQVL